MSVELATGFTRDDVRKRFEKYSSDHYGDVSDLPNLCETMVAFGERRGVEITVEFSDILPRISHIEARVRAIRRLLLEILSEAEDVEQEALF